MCNKEFFSKIVRGIRNFFNFTQRNSEFLSFKIPPHPPIKFFPFKVENIVFADIFVFLHTKKTTVLPYNRLCFQVQVLGALNQF